MAVAFAFAALVFLTTCLAFAFGADFALVAFDLGVPSELPGLPLATRPVPGVAAGDFINLSDEAMRQQWCRSSSGKSIG